MIGSTIVRIYRIDGEKNSTIIETTAGYYRIDSGFFKVDEQEINDHKIVFNPDKKGERVIEVRATMEFTVIRLSDDDLITFHVDTPFLEISNWDKIKDDKEYLEWYFDDLQELSNEINYAVVK